MRMLQPLPSLRKAFPIQSRRLVRSVLKKNWSLIESTCSVFVRFLIQWGAIERVREIAKDLSRAMASQRLPSIWYFLRNNILNSMIVLQYIEAEHQEP